MPGKISRDSRYPLLPYLLTPKLRQPEGSPSVRYTNSHVIARSSIERTIGMVKGQWRCLRKEKALHYTPEFSALIINACCVLYNMAKFYNVPQPEIYFDELDIEERNITIDGIRNENGNEVRERVIQHYLT